MNRSPQTSRSSDRLASPASPRAFTLIEVMVAVVIVILIASMGAVAVGHFVRGSRLSAEQSNLRSLSMSTEQFKQTFGFYVPLVNDFSAAPGGPIRQHGPTAFTVRLAGQLEAQPDLPLPPLKFLSYESGNPNDPRYSELSVPYYLLGVLGKEVDGVDGPGMTKPFETPQATPWRSFLMQGRKIDPLYDVGSDRTRLVTRDASGNPVSGAGAEVQSRLLDRWNGPIRYYRWEPLFHGPATPGRPTTPANEVAQTGEVRDYGQPALLGDPRQNATLRAMKWALVSKGPDGLVNDNDRADKVNVDNVIIGEGGSLIEGGGS